MSKESSVLRLRAELLKNVDVVAEHGEGPVFDPRDRSLLWLDIDQRLLHRLSLESGARDLFTLPGRVGKLVPRQKGDFLIWGNVAGVGVYRLGSAAPTKVFDKPLPLTGPLLANDAGVDPLGRFWFGSMHAELQSEASLWCLDLNEKVSKRLTGVKISNGIEWVESDGAWNIYYVDSPTGLLRGWKYDLKAGTFGSESWDVLKFPEGHAPDGMCADADGNLYIALWGAGQVVKVNPADGSILCVIDVPGAVHTSACCLVGSTLYITSSRQGLSDASLEENPNSGRLFACEVNSQAREPFLAAI